MDAIESKEYKGYTISIYYDESAANPREEWDNLGTMVCFHRRYNLGDKTDLKSDQFDGWAELEDHLIREEHAVIILPLYLYDHSGITISTGNGYPYNDRWDAGQVGFIYVSRETLLKEYGKKRVTKKAREYGERVLRQEVKTYDDYLTGSTFGWAVEDEDGDTLDSCWGYYGHEEFDFMYEQGQSVIDGLVRDNTESAGVREAVNAYQDK